MTASVVLCSKTRFGKSTTSHHLLETAKQEVVLDQQRQSTARERWKRSIETGKKAILEDLDDITRMIPLSVLPISAATNAITRRQEEALSIEHLLETLIRRRGSANVDANPLIEQTIENWCRLVYGQPTAVDISEALRVFHNKAIRNRYIENCSDVEAAAWWG